MINPPLALGLLGYPLGHSLSPLLHKAALKNLGLPGDYRLLPVPKKHQLQDYCQQLRQGAIHGLNITIPWKIEIIDYLDHLTAEAKEIGAVNTLYTSNDQLVGANTDALGLHEEIQRIYGPKFNHSGQRALILGAGGAARAAAWVLCRMGWEVTIAARQIAKAHKLKYMIKDPTFNLKAIAFAPEPLAQAMPNLLINATPLGMAPKIDEMPWPTGLGLPEKAVVFDLVYNPPETRLIKKARGNGLRAFNGAGMLVSQAAAAFQLWTGIQPPSDVMFEALKHTFAKTQRSSK